MGTRGEKIRRDGGGSPVDQRQPAARGHPTTRTAGQSSGVPAADQDQEQELRTAYDVKELHVQLATEFTDDELRGIPVIPEGQRLQQGGVYIDLKDPKRKEFTATGDMTAGARNRYTSKSEVPYPLWNRLIGNSSRIQRRKNGG
jgi:hypothetical protein